jgi:hypothetical protein
MASPPGMPKVIEHSQQAANPLKKLNANAIAITARMTITLKLLKQGKSIAELRQGCKYNLARFWSGTMVQFGDQRPDQRPAGQLAVADQNVIRFAQLAEMVQGVGARRTEQQSKVAAAPKFSHLVCRRSMQNPIPAP